MKAPTDPARKAVLRQLAAAHDTLLAVEQQHVIEGRYIEAEGAHVIGLRLLRAYKAESDDPAPVSR